MSNYGFFFSFLVLTLGKFLEALESGIGTGLVFCLSNLFRTLWLQYDTKIEIFKFNVQLIFNKKGVVTWTEDECCRPQ